MSDALVLQNAPSFFNLRQCSSILGLSTRTVRELVKKQKIAAARISPRGDLRFTREALENFIADHTTVPKKAVTS